MIKITRRSWSRPTHGGQREEQDWIVSLNDVQLAVYSTYSTDCKPQGDPRLAASVFATTLLSALRPTLEDAQTVLTYREGTAPYNAAETALQTSIAQLYDDLAKELR